MIKESRHWVLLALRFVVEMLEIPKMLFKFLGRRAPAGFLFCQICSTIQGSYTQCIQTESLFAASCQMPCIIDRVGSSITDIVRRTVSKSSHQGNDVPSLAVLLSFLPRQSVTVQNIQEIWLYQIRLLTRQPQLNLLQSVGSPSDAQDSRFYPLRCHSTPVWDNLDGSVHPNLSPIQGQYWRMESLGLLPKSLFCFDEGPYWSFCPLPDFFPFSSARKNIQKWREGPYFPPCGLGPEKRGQMDSDHNQRQGGNLIFNSTGKPTARKLS